MTFIKVSFLGHPVLNKGWSMVLEEQTEHPARPYIYTPVYISILLCIICYIDLKVTGWVPAKWHVGLGRQL